MGCKLLTKKKLWGRKEYNTYTAFTMISNEQILTSRQEFTNVIMRCKIFSINKVHSPVTPLKGQLWDFLQTSKLLIINNIFNTKSIFQSYKKNSPLYQIRPTSRQGQCLLLITDSHRQSTNNKYISNLMKIIISLQK